jgi:protoporphyrinogen oxidase
MNYVIVGGGITGLLSAKILRDRHPNANVCILEKENTIGGLLTGISYKENGIYFDTGTHIFQETGNSNIDDILINSIDSDSLIHYRKGKGDLAGLFINGILQKNSYFPDLRNEKISKDILNSVRNHVASGVKIESVDSCKSLLMVANSRFGSRFTDDIITPIFEKVFGLPVKDMSAFALSLTGWTRVILDDFDDWFTNISNESYKSIVAVPDQRKLPVQMHHGRRSFYSKINGSNALINGLRDSLIARNVEIITGADIELINKGDKKIFFKCNSSDKKKY